MSSRARWLTGGALVMAAAAAAVAVVIVTTGGKSGEVGVPSTRSTTTISGSSSSGGSPVTVGIICTSPTDAAQSLVNAWTAGDRAAAARCASTTAVDKLFQTGGAGAQWTFQGCTTAGGTATCQYSYEGGAAKLSVTGSDAAGWKVGSVSFVAD